MSNEALNALRWVLSVVGDKLKPWQAWFEEGTQCVSYHCYGCDGEFVSTWPNWEEPTEETFPHKPGCRYLWAIGVVKNSSVCHVCGGDQRITPILSFGMAIRHCETNPAHNVAEPYLSQLRSAGAS